MYIKMTDDKELLITIPTTIYRGETKADLITFLIPNSLGDLNVADCIVTMRYILPDGVGHSEALSVQPEMYKSYLQYSTVVNTRLTKQDGDVTVWLQGFDHDATGVLFKTGEVIIPIHESKNIADYLSGDDLDQLEQIAAQLVELDEAITELDNTKADDITYNEDDGTLQLLANNQKIGTMLDFHEAVGDANEVIKFEDDGSIKFDDDGSIEFED